MRVFLKLAIFRTFFLILTSQEFCDKDTLPPACLFERGGLKDSKTGFEFLLAQKLRELEQFEKVHFFHTKFHLVKFCMVKMNFFKML